MLSDIMNKTLVKMDAYKPFKILWDNVYVDSICFWVRTIFRETTAKTKYMFKETKVFLSLTHLPFREKIHWLRAFCKREKCLFFAE